jgi:predicted permease
VQTFTNISIKNLIQPAMMAAAGLAFGLSHTLLQQVVIIGATPSAIAAGMFALRSDTYIDTASSSILIGTAVGADRRHYDLFNFLICFNLNSLRS